MLGKLLLVFILVPLTELFLLLWIAERTSVPWTITLVILTGIAGTLLARAEGLRAWRRFRQASALGRLPSTEIQDGLLIAFAAALLMTPGLLTDTFGLLLLIPATRQKFLSFLKRSFFKSFKVTVFHSNLERQAYYEADNANPEQFSVGPIDPDRKKTGPTIIADRWRRIENTEDD